MNPADHVESWLLSKREKARKSCRFQRSYHQREYYPGQSRWNKSCYTRDPQDTKSRLLDLPPEILTHIFEYLVGTSDIINLVDLRVQWAKIGRRRTAKRWHLPSPIRKMQAVLRTCHSLRYQGMVYIFSHHKFINLIRPNFKRFPEVFSTQQLSMIQRLELKIDFHVKTRHESEWPYLLDILGNRLNSLSFLKLHTEYLSCKPALFEAEDPEGTSRCKQECRTMLRLGAFVVLRNKNLSLMVYPAYSGDDRPETSRCKQDCRKLIQLEASVVLRNKNPWLMTYPVYPRDNQPSTCSHRTVCAVELFSNQARRSYNSRPRLLADGSLHEGTVEDILLNTTKIRRYTSHQLLTMPVASFVIPWLSETSEVAEETAVFQEVEDNAYQQIRCSPDMTADHMIIRAQKMYKDELSRKNLEVEVRSHIDTCCRFRLQTLEWLEKPVASTHGLGPTSTEADTLDIPMR